MQVVCPQTIDGEAMNSRTNVIKPVTMGKNTRYHLWSTHDPYSVNTEPNIRTVPNSSKTKSGVSDPPEARPAT